MLLHQLVSLLPCQELVMNCRCLCNSDGYMWIKLLLACWFLCHTTRCFTTSNELCIAAAAGMWCFTTLLMPALMHLQVS